MHEPDAAAWTSCRIGGGGYVHAIVTCPSNPSRVYAHSDIGGVFRSDDGGLTWRMIHGGFPAVPGANEVRGILADPRHEDRLLAASGGLYGEPVGLLLTEDGGASWSLVAPVRFYGNGPRRWDGAVLARCPQRPDLVLAAGAGDGVWRSENGGRNWEPGGPSGLYPTDLKWDRRDPARIWLCAHVAAIHGASLAGGLWRSGDAGRTWQRLADEAPTELVPDPVEEGALVGIFANRRIARSRDAGLTWTPYHEGLPAGDGSEEEFTGDARYQALAAGPDFLLAGSSRGSLWRRGYRAPRWERIVPLAVEEGDWWGAMAGRAGAWPLRGAGLSSLTVDPANPDRWWWTDWFAVYRTVDAGRRWQLAVEGMEGTAVHALARDPADPLLVHAGLADAGYFRSEDGGRSFRSVPFPGGGTNVRAFATNGRQPARVFATGSSDYSWACNQVWRSDDGGRAWARVPGMGLPDPATHALISVACAWWNPDEVFVTASGVVEPGAGGVYWSADGGQHFVWTGDGLPPRPLFRDSIFDLRGSEVAAGRSGAVLAISKTSREIWRAAHPGEPWETIMPAWAGDAWPVGVLRDPHRDGVWYLAARGDGVYRSLDDGRSWTRLLAESALGVAADEQVAGRLAASGEDGVWLSADDGGTWARRGTGLPNRIGPAVALSGAGLLAGTGGNGVFISPW